MSSPVSSLSRQDSGHLPYEDVYSAEMSVLGAILLDQGCTPKVTALISEEDFFLERNRMIFTLLVALYAENIPADLVTVCNRLKEEGNLERAGGGSYVAELVEFTPTSQNVAFYARIVRKKAREQKIAGLARELALDPGNLPELLPRLSELTEDEELRQAGKQLKVLSLQELLETSFPEREKLLSPVILTQSLSMIHAWRGLGKTHVGLGIAYAVASGGRFLKWRSPQPRGVLYLDGEMPGSALQERLSAITAASDRKPLPDYFRIITPDLQDLGCMPDLSTVEGQTAVNAMLTPETALIVVDNISCLCRSGRENEAESWLPVQGWALRQRSAGRAVLFIHHSGKNGEQRGASKREDILDTVIKLKRPVDYEPSQGAVFELIFEKARHLTGEDTASFEARLTTNQATGLQAWVYKDVAQTSFERVVNLAGEGLSQSEIAKELQINKSNISRHWKKAIEQGLIQRNSK
jgi:hypothetical protein